MNSDIDEKTKVEIDKKIKVIMSRFLDDPVYSKNKYIEAICLFFARLKFNFTSKPYFKTKYFLQRLFRGYDDLDKWNVAWYIARKSIPVLKEMRNSFVGTSIKWHREDRFGNIEELTKDEAFANEEPEALSEDEWRAILDDIIFSFQFILDEDDYDGEIFNEEIYNKRHARYKRGLRLFSIYYGNLWD